MSSLTRLLRRAFSATTKPTSLTKAYAGEPLTRTIYDERDLQKVVINFKKCSESVTFRSKSTIYQNAVRRLASAKLFNSIEEILEEQKKYKDISEEGFVVRLIRLYGKSGMFDHAYKLFDEMPELKCERTVKSFNAVLSACLNSKKYDKIEGLFRELPAKLSIKPTCVSYNTVIKAFCDMGSLESALSMLDEMEKNGEDPDVFTFNILLHALYRNNRFRDGEELWKRMKKCNVQPDVLSYQSKLEGLVSEKHVQKARDLIEEMKKKELKPSFGCYNNLIKAYCSEGDLDEAKWCYYDMKKSGCKPNKSTFTALLPIACEKNDFFFAFLLSKEGLRLRCGVEEALLQQVVDGLVKKSKINEAKELVKLGVEKKATYKLTIPEEV